MAEQFAAAYAHIPFHALYTSPLRRAVQSAEPISNALGVATEVREELKEIAFGEWEGMSVAEVDLKFHESHQRWLGDPAWNAPPGGETVTSLATRALGFVESVTRKFTDGNVLAVSHKATIRVTLCGLLGIEVGRHRYRLSCPVGSLSVVELTSHGAMLQRLADRAHLDERLRNLPGT